MVPLTIPILRLLSDGEFHSGETLARNLKVSRSSIWNALQAANAFGVLIYKVRGRGYQMPTPLEWYEDQKIVAHLGSQAEKISLHIQDVVDSTNSQQLKLVALPNVHGRCLIAEIQTNGRGRRGRPWQGVLGGSLSFSIIWQFNMGVAQLSGLSLAVGVALARALRELGLLGIQLKWPNDLLHNFHKLGGVLIELQGEALGPSSTVVGIGLNYRLNALVKNKIDQAVSDLASVKPDIAPRNQVIGVVLRHLTSVLAEFEQKGFGAFRQEWQELHAYQDKPVGLRMPDGSEIFGIVRNVSEEGALILETVSGERRFGSGEISLRSNFNTTATMRA